MPFKLSRSQKLLAVVGISAAFFLFEISIGFYTRSLALIADSFHYLNDLIAYIVAYAASRISERTDSPKGLSFGWQRAQLLGAFFNGVFLLALGLSIFLQAIERFISIEKIQNPKLVLIVGCVGLTLNIVSVIFLHDHDHGHSLEEIEFTAKGEEKQHSSTTPHVGLVAPEHHPHDLHRHKASKKAATHHHHDLGVLGVLIHLLGDAVNNVGVIIAALVIWKTTSEHRYYADPAVTVAIAIMIFCSALPLVKKSGTILMECAPMGIDPGDIKHDLESIPGVESIHELHVWSLDQRKAIASAHVVVTDETLANFMDLANTMTECLHAYGIHSATLQPELARPEAIIIDENRENTSPTNELRRRSASSRIICKVKCPTLDCVELTCCSSLTRLI